MKLIRSLFAATAILIVGSSATSASVLECDWSNPCVNYCLMNTHNILDFEACVSQCGPGACDWVG